MWTGILKEWTEIVQPFPALYNPQHTACTRIDRRWVHCPSKALAEFNIISHGLDSPQMFWEWFHRPCAINLFLGAKTKESKRF